MNPTWKRRLRSWAGDALFAAAAVGAVLAVGYAGWSASIVRTPSMEPGISPGDIVVSQAVSSDHQYQEGDIIVFHPRITGQEEMPAFVHRIETVEEDGRLITKGDNNSNIDPWRVYPEDVVGEHQFTLPTHYMRHPAVVPALGAVLAMTVAWPLLSRRKSPKE